MAWMVVAVVALVPSLGDVVDVFVCTGVMHDCRYVRQSNQLFTTVFSDRIVSSLMRSKRAPGLIYLLTHLDVNDASPLAATCAATVSGTCVADFLELPAPLIQYIDKMLDVPVVQIVQVPQVQDTQLQIIEKSVEILENRFDQGFHVSERLGTAPRRHVACSDTVVVFTYPC